MLAVRPQPPVTTHGSPPPRSHSTCVLAGLSACVSGLHLPYQQSLASTLIAPSVHASRVARPATGAREGAQLSPIMSGTPRSPARW